MVNDSVVVLTGGVRGMETVPVRLCDVRWISKGRMLVIERSRSWKRVPSGLGKTYLLRTAIAMLLLPVAHAATTPPATVTGTLQTPAGTPALNTFARFELTYCGGNMGRVTGASLVAFVPFDVHTNSSGVYSTSLFGNDQITCGATLGLSRWRITPATPRLTRMT